MKKLILFVVLLFSLTISAQKEEMVKFYTRVLIKGTWEETDLVIAYHYLNQSNRLSMVLNKQLVKYEQIGETLRGFTLSGKSYQLLTFINLGTSETIHVQYFEEHENYGVRIFFDDGLILQLVEEEE